MTSPEKHDQPIVDPQHRGLTRRSLLRRALVAGTATPLLAGLLAACGGSSESTPEPTTAGESSGGGTATSQGSSTTAGASPSANASPGTSQGQGSAAFPIEPPKNKGGIIRWGTSGDARTINPIVANDQASGMVGSLLFEGVMRADPATASPVGDLAKSWEISDDGVTYSFVLTDGVKWHDGEPFTANDVKFTYGVIQDPDSKSSYTSTVTDRVKSIDVVDDTHFTVTLNAPNAAFLASNMGYGIVPEHILKDVPVAQQAQHEFSTGKKGVTVGTGPFQFEEWVKDDHVTLSKYADYWQGEPNIDQWIFKVVPNTTVLVQQLKTGEIDYADIQPSDVADMQTESGVRVHASDSLSFEYYAYNLDTEKTTLFQEKEVRQALRYALETDAMVDAVYFGLAEVAVGSMPVLSWAYDPDAITVRYDFDLDKANSLLDQAGWKPGSDGIREKDGKRLAFEFWTTGYRQTFTDMTSICQAAWKKIGVEVTLRTEETNAFLNRITVTHDFDMMFVSFGWGVDPDQTSMWSCDGYKGGFNMSKYCNPQVDKLLKDGLATNDQEERKRIYAEMQNILMEDLPAPILFFPKRIAGVNKRVHNLFPNVIDVMFTAHQWWLDA